ncbi:MAG TPA: helix-turn-helix domain-containing protein [Candidatus Nanopelagicaceae bacterium]
MTSFRRTRSAILEATKKLIAEHGLQVTSMIEIADTAEVSRATLYNHFRSKESVVRGLLESEVTRILAIASSEGSAGGALARISMEISSDPALATMRAYDSALLTQLLSAGADPLWQQVHEVLMQILDSQERVELALRWLIGQVFAPLTAEQSAQQVGVITG